MAREFQITARHDGYRYHTFTVRAETVRGALEEAARNLPDEIAASTDLVELREVVDPESRSYVGG